MVKNKVIDYAKFLKELGVTYEIISNTNEVFQVLPQVKAEFENPTIPLQTKHNIIDKVFPVQIRSILKILCDNNEIDLWNEIVEIFRNEDLNQKDEFVVELFYVTPPTEEQLEGLKKFIIKKYNREDILFVNTQKIELGGGFVIKVNDEEYDWSTKGRLRQLSDKIEELENTNHSSELGIISILKSQIEDFDLKAQDKEIGFVSWVGDGIANINGIDHAVYGEIVIFDSGVKGMVQDIRREEIGCILFGRDDEIREGTRVVRTGKMAGMPVGEKFLGRIVDALGAPIDGQGAIKEAAYRPIEEEAPSIIARKSVGVPMETGILAIDSMFPIGRGQRELIIGDRQTGKTSIAIDTIINQKGKDIICIYVAIGQKASTVAKIAATLNKKDCMEHTIIVSATASDPASMQYIAPYSATALAEYFMYQGKDVLIVYDDLSKHAVAYRAISLLLERSPGREAYPGDVFYLHSRLLERSSRLHEDFGGGSITALPIIETQNGDVSAYIPTNVISITDGQIFLESNLFFAGIRPAVNVGLSVSRVGGAAQTKATKTAAGSLRIDLAQYREMEVFTQFASDLDSATKDQLKHGKILMELLKQPLANPLAMYQQVIILSIANKKIMLDIPVKRIKEFQTKFLEFMDENHSEIGRTIETTKKLDDDTLNQVLQIANEYKKNFNIV